MENLSQFSPVRSKYILLTTSYLIPFVVIIAVLFGSYFLLYSSFFKISKIECYLDYLPCPDTSILTEINKLHGHNLFRLSGEHIKSKLTSADFTIREVVLSKKLPNTLIFELQSVYPVISIKSKDTPRWVVLDQQLRVIGERASNPNVPSLVISSNLNLIVGKQLTEVAIVQALNFVLQLVTELPSLKESTLIDDHNLTVLLASNQSAIFDPAKDFSPQIQSLRALLSDATIIKSVKTIDVRFTQPVLR